MPLALPQLDTRAVYERLATLYTIIFALAAGSFYLSLLERGYDVSLALFAAAAAGLHYMLLRLAGVYQPKVVAPAVERYRPATVLTDLDLMTRLDQLRHEARASREELGLMLIRLSSGGERSEPPPASVMKLVRGELFRGADSRIFQMDDRTLAIAEAQSDLVLHFDKIAGEVHRQLRASYSRTSEPPVRATVGVAVTGGGRCSARDLVENALTSIRLAEANLRDTFFRRVD